MKQTHPFDPIVFPDSKILILGSFPSLDSFKHAFYYAHPRNQFWPLLGALYTMPVETKKQKIALLKAHHLALWDVVGGCERTNSLDTNLRACTPNDIPTLLDRTPTIERILFTGAKAQELFTRFFGSIALPAQRLPSPSPANARMRYEEKLAAYKRALLG